MTGKKLKNNGSLYFLLTFALLLFCIGYVFVVAMNYDNAWIQPERFNIIQSVLKGSNSSLLHDFERIFDTKTWEFENRTTRPLGHLLDIWDVRLRSYLWTQYFPHPSISLTWIFVLFLTPFMLWKVAGTFGANTLQKLWALIFYSSSQGTLSLVSMHFRSGKALSCFFILLNVYLFSAINWRRPSRFFPLALFLFLTFFIDETCLAAFPILLFLHYKKMARPQRLSFYLMPFLYAALVIFLFPRITAALGFDSVALDQYHPAYKFITAFGIKGIGYQLINIWVFLIDLLSLYNPINAPNIALGLLLALNWFLPFFLERPRIDFPLKDAGVIFLICFLLNSIFLQSTGNFYWAIFWYGTFIVPWYALLLGLLVGKFRREKIVLIYFACLALSQCFIFPYTNRVYKTVHYYPHNPTLVRSIFIRESDRFRFPGGVSIDAKFQIARTIDCLQSNKNCMVIKEILYVPLEKFGLQLGDLHPYRPGFRDARLLEIRGR